MKKTTLNQNTHLTAPQRKMRKGWLLVFGAAFLTFSIFFLGPVADSAEDSESQIEQTREALRSWVEVRGEIAQEKRDLTLAKQMLNERIELVKQEIIDLRDKISNTEEGIAEADKNRAKMLAESEQLKAASDSLAANLVRLESGVKKLLVRLPDPIRDRVKPMSQRIPEDPDDTKLSVAQRLQSIVYVLNEIDKFNRQINTSTELRNLPDGTTVEVASAYVGIGQGYYVSANKTVAGVGRATEEGWEWKPANESAEQISDIIAILNNEKVASFVQVPVEIQ